MDILLQIFSDYTLRTVSIGAAIIGTTGGVLGSFAVLRRQSLLGDALTHCALPGIVGAYMLTGSKATPVLLLGAFISAFIGAVFMKYITRNSAIKEDGALGLVLSVFFGLGLVLLTYIQKLPDASQAGLETFLFGQAATIMMDDVVFMLGVSFFLLLSVGIFWKEFKLLSFDSEFGATAGFNMRTLDIFLTTLLVLAIVLGLQTVGVVLMSAMVVAPAAIARQWTDRFFVMVLLAAGFGALCSVCGAVISSSSSNLPTGPVIVIVLSFFVLISLLFAPGRGIFWKWIVYEKTKRTLRLEAALINLRALCEHHRHDTQKGHEECVLRSMDGVRAPLNKTLEMLQEKGWAIEVQKGKWAITKEGLNESQKFADSLNP